MQGNGWNDIGYNFLVDRFGTVYEGRYGGIDRAVVGAHARGFNTGSVGVALLGTYTGAAPTKAAQNALTSLLAWRLDLAHTDPLSMQNVISGGSERWPAKVPVLLRTVSGHRDTGFTECPGGTLYARLNQIAADAAKLRRTEDLRPTGRGERRGPGALPRAALAGSVLDRHRHERWCGGRGAERRAPGKPSTGRGTRPRCSRARTDGPSGPAPARPGTGTMRAGLGTETGTAIAISEASVTPGGITPNGDGQGDVADISFSLSAPANVTVEVADAAGTVVATVLDRAWQAAGKHTITVDGAALSDGAYTVNVRARTATTAEVVQTVPLLVSRTLGLVSASPGAFSPNGDGRNDQLEIGFALTVPASVTVRIVREGRWVASPALGASFVAG